MPGRLCHKSGQWKLPRCQHRWLQHTCTNIKHQQSIIKSNAITNAFKPRQWRPRLICEYCYKSYSDSSPNSLCRQSTPLSQTSHTNPHFPSPLPDSPWQATVRSHARIPSLFLRRPVLHLSLCDCGISYASEKTVTRTIFGKTVRQNTTALGTMHAIVEVRMIRRRFKAY